MTISAKLILKSRNVDDPEEDRHLSTVLCRYPRWIHAEGRTHRQLRLGESLTFDSYTPSPMEESQLSRNASSSRAIPVKRMIQDVLDDPAIPIYWGRNQKGMQAGDECSTVIKFGNMWYERQAAWLHARDRAIEMASAFDAAGYHKQIVNRLLEPFSHINVLYSGTEWSNFFALRIHDDAEPHIRDLAIAIRDAIAVGPVQELNPHSKVATERWHLPFASSGDDLKAVVNYDESASFNTVFERLRVLSVARCASTSYKTVEGTDMTVDRALALYEKLAGGTPLHASPFEHQAEADIRDGKNACWEMPYWLHGNLVGFRQYRKMLPGECM